MYTIIYLSYSFVEYMYTLIQHALCMYVCTIHTQSGVKYTEWVKQKIDDKICAVATYLASYIHISCVQRNNENGYLIIFFIYIYMH